MIRVVELAKKSRPYKETSWHYARWQYLYARFVGAEFIPFQTQQTLVGAEFIPFHTQQTLVGAEFIPFRTQQTHIGATFLSVLYKLETQQQRSEFI